MIKVLVGMIASGKSTYAAAQAAKFGSIVINDDAIVTVVHGGNYRLYDKKLKPLYKGVENEILHLAVMAGHNVVIDCGRCVCRGTRQRFIALAKSLDQPVAAVLFPREDAEIHAMRRFQSNTRGYSYQEWLTIATHHACLYSRPAVTEGFEYVTELRNKDIENLLCPQ